jgi:glycosyltransferase involved in cell wall biosynthesis
MPVSRSVAEVTQSLNSALGQSFRDIEVLVSDDVGHGRQAVDRADDERVLYWRNSPSLGFTGNHEALLGRARGQLIAFLHDDDRWEPSYLDEAVRRLAASPAAGFVITAHRETPDGPASSHPPSGCYADALSVLLDPQVRLLPSATVMRRAILPDVRRPWPSLSCGDMVLYLDAAVAGWGVAVIDTALVHYARHPKQISADATGFREDLARLFELYRFDDPAVERLRRSRLGMSRLSAARAHLRTGRHRDVRANVADARAARPGARSCLEGAALIALSQRPTLLRATLGAWYVIRGVPATARSGRAG